MSSLLPIPDGVTKPNAYQVFGIEGPAELPEVAAAIRRTVDALQSAKATSDPQRWQMAATMVQRARAFLADPPRKAKLDAKLRAAGPAGPAGPAGAAKTTGVAEAADPLAGILPKVAPPVQPIAAPEPVAEPPSAPETIEKPVIAPEPAERPPIAPVVAPPQIPAGPAPFSPEPVAPGPVAPGPVAAEKISLGPVAAASPVVVSPTRYRRRRSPVPTILMSMICLGLLGLVGILAYVVLIQPGSVSIVRSGDGVTISTGGPVPGSRRSTDPPVVRRPSPDRGAGVAPVKRRPFDPVMGSMAGDVPPPEMKSTIPQSVEGLGDVGLENVRQPDTEKKGVGTVTPESTSRPDDQSMVAAQSRLRQAAQAIRNRDWEGMKSSIESMRDLPMTPEQSDRMEALYAVADLASYFRGGILIGIERQEAANQFEITDGVQVSFVGYDESTQTLTLKTDRGIQSYPLDTLPYSIADRMAKFAIGPVEDFEIAAAVYHCVAPEASERTMAVELAFLRGADRMVGEVSTGAIADAVEFVFGG